ncbi:hypothetical protein D3C87_935150 [compost metagenome]
MVAVFSSMVALMFLSSACPSSVSIFISLRTASNALFCSRKSFIDVVDIANASAARCSIDAV